MHATVATPPCWGDAARLLSLLFHALVVLFGGVLWSAFSHPNDDSSIATAVVLILSCSLSFSLSSPAQMRSSDRLPSPLLSPPPPYLSIL